MQKYIEIFVGMLTRPSAFLNEVDETYVSPGEAIVYASLVGGVVGLIGSLLGGAFFGQMAGIPILAGLMFGIVGAILSVIVGSFIILIVHTLFIKEGEGSFANAIKAYGLSYTSQVASIVPFIGGFVAIVWGFYLLYLTLQKFMKLSSRGAMKLIIILAVIVLVISLVILLTAGAVLFTFMQGMGEEY